MAGSVRVDAAPDGCGNGPSLGDCGRVVRRISRARASAGARGMDDGSRLEQGWLNGRFRRRAHSGGAAVCVAGLDTAADGAPPPQHTLRPLRPFKFDGCECCRFRGSVLRLRGRVRCGHTVARVFALRTPWAVGVTAFSLAAYAGALVLLDNPPAPVQQFINVVASAGAAGVLIGGLASRLDRSRRQLADFNHNLEARVNQQVGELERAGRLRRFLSP